MVLKSHYIKGIVPHSFGVKLMIYCKITKI
nr:MAG TPA: hypothetical protein [Caudoviricetes sp.]